MTLTVELIALDESTARSLTDKIAHHVQNAGQLIAQAFELRADRILGYPSWNAYVESEFGIKARESRNLIQVARVQKALGQPAPLSIRASRLVERNLPEVLDRVDHGETIDAVVVELDRRKTANHRQVASFDFCYYFAAASTTERTRNGLPGYTDDNIADIWEIRDQAFPIATPTTKAEVEPWCIELARAIYREVIRRPLPTMPRQVQL